MLTGWHYLDYYANTYALNQYLVNQGFIVLAVNYRLGTGYGYEFQYPQQAGMYGAAEYLDIKAAGEWLAAQTEVDAARIGVYGGSYGGFLTAMALGKDSKLFAAGVDIHGEHNYLKWAPEPSYEPAPDAAAAVKRIWASSPVAWLDQWTSPVLLIHGDDDGNVAFGQSVDLVRRLEQKQVPYETLVIPDETHHWMLYKHMLQVDLATAAFLQRKLVNIKPVAAARDTLQLGKNITAAFRQCPEGKFAMAFKDLTTGETLLLNAAADFHAASTMKTPVLVEAYQQAAANKFKLSDSILVHTTFKSIVDGSPFSLDSSMDSEKEIYKWVNTNVTIATLLYKMITKSCNLATNIMIEKLGAENVMATMKSIGATHLRVLRGVEDAKAFQLGLNNTVTAYDLMLVFERIGSGTMVNAAACEGMINILLQQTFNSMIPARLPAGVTVAHKTGAIQGICHDSGIIFLPDGRKYVLVLLSKGITRKGVADEVLAGVSREVYDYMMQKKAVN
jgi:beta-lactamase class A/alpha/beta superfamily hydrolase